jgi:hypothetical protein
MHVLHVGLQSGRGVGAAPAFNAICGVHCKKRPKDQAIGCEHSFAARSSS